MTNVTRYTSEKFPPDIEDAVLIIEDRTAPLHFDMVAEVKEITETTITVEELHSDRRHTFDWNGVALDGSSRTLRESSAQEFTAMQRFVAVAELIEELRTHQNPLLLRYLFTVIAHASEDTLVDLGCAVRIHGKE